MWRNGRRKSRQMRERAGEKEEEGGRDTSRRREEEGGKDTGRCREDACQENSPEEKRRGKGWEERTKGRKTDSVHVDVDSTPRETCSTATTTQMSVSRAAPPIASQPPTSGVAHCLASYQ